MNDWFRSWHGAPTDPKWLLIARKASVTPGLVSAVVWALFDHASQRPDRGRVADFDVETYAAFSGFGENEIDAVLVALREKGVIVGGRLAAWDQRQPKREDGSAERAAAWRERQKGAKNADEHTKKRPTTPERNRTQPNAEEHREEESREDRTEASASIEATASAAIPADSRPLPEPTAEERYWAIADQLEGRGVARSRMGQLQAAHNGNYRALIPLAETILNSREPGGYLGKILAGLREAEGKRAAPRRRAAQADEPDFVRNARAEGQAVVVGTRKNGRPNFTIGRETFDEAGQLIGF